MGKVSLISRKLLRSPRPCVLSLLLVSRQCQPLPAAYPMISLLDDVTNGTVDYISALRPGHTHLFRDPGVPARPLLWHDRGIVPALPPGISRCPRDVAESARVCCVTCGGPLAPRPGEWCAAETELAHPPLADPSPRIWPRTRRPQRWRAATTTPVMSRRASAAPSVHSSRGRHVPAALLCCVLDLLSSPRQHTHSFRCTVAGARSCGVLRPQRSRGAASGAGWRCAAHCAIPAAPQLDPLHLPRGVPQKLHASRVSAGAGTGPKTDRATAPDRWDAGGRLSLQGPRAGQAPPRHVAHVAGAVAGVARGAPGPRMGPGPVGVRRRVGGKPLMAPLGVPVRAPLALLDTLRCRRRHVLCSRGGGALCRAPPHPRPRDRVTPGVPLAPLCHNGGSSARRWHATHLPADWPA